MIMQPAYWYLSFAKPEIFLGAVIIQAGDSLIAREKMWILGIENPGGEMAAWPLSPEDVPSEAYRNRLLSIEEIREIYPEAKSLKDWKANLPS